MGRAALIVAGVSIGVLIGIGGFALLDDERPSPVIGTGQPPVTPFPAIDHDPAAAEDLAAAWQRWRTSTHYARGTWSRRLDQGGAPLQGPVLTVQDPPRRLTVRLGSVVELIDATTRACDADVAGGALPPACTLAEGDLSYAERVGLELATIADYVGGDPRPFDIGYGAAGCFRAENRALLPAAPWGLWAEFCFDPASGAMASARIRRDTAVDTEIMFEIRADVTDADFELG